MPSWNDAVKIWNAQRTGKYVIPKKGSDEYNEIRKLMGEDAKPAKPAPSAPAAPQPIWNEAVKIWNAKRTGKYIAPKKGTAEYEEVQTIVDRLKSSGKTETAPPAPTDVVVKRKAPKPKSPPPKPKSPAKAKAEETYSDPKLWRRWPGFGVIHKNAEDHVFQWDEIDREFKYLGLYDKATDTINMPKVLPSWVEVEPEPEPEPKPKPKPPKAVDKDELVPFMFNGNKMFKNGRDEVYTNKDGKPGMYLGVYDDKTYKISTYDSDDSDEETGELSPFRQEQIRRQKEIDDDTEAGFINLRVATRNSNLSKAEKEIFLDKISKDYDEFIRKRDEKMAYLMRRSARK